MRNRWMLAAYVALACGPAAGEGDSGSTDEVGTADAAALAAGDTTLPAAILGTAPPPRGEDIAYVEGRPETVGYVSVPEGEGPFPAVILIHEWDGLVDRIRQTADALADEGYVALATDLYAGAPGRVAPKTWPWSRRRRPRPMR